MLKKSEKLKKRPQKYLDQVYLIGHFMQGKQNLKQAPRFEFQSVKDEQRRAILEIERAEDSFIFHLENSVPPCKHSLKAKNFLREAIRQCNAAILFHWNEK